MPLAAWYLTLAVSIQMTLEQTADIVLAVSNQVPITVMAAYNKTIGNDRVNDKLFAGAAEGSDVRPCEHCCKSSKVEYHESRFRCM